MKKKEQTKKNFKRDAVILFLAALSAAILIYLFPEKKAAVFDASKRFFLEMILILPAVMILMGLFAVWVSEETVMKHLGKASGPKGVVLSILFGALPTGPLYVAFPAASALLNKGASVSNVMIFLSAWACVKIPQEIVEFQFLGGRFMLVRLSLTIVFVVIMGKIIEILVGKTFWPVNEKGVMK